MTIDHDAARSTLFVLLVVLCALTVQAPAEGQPKVQVDLATLGTDGVSLDNWSYVSTETPSTTPPTSGWTPALSLVNLRGLFSGVFLSFALLHMLLFLYRRETLENLYFSLFCLALATLSFLLVHKELVADPRIRFWSESLMNAVALGFAVVGVLFVYRALNLPIPKVVRWSFVAIGGLVPFAAGWPAATLLVVFLVILGGLFEMARRVFVSWFHREEGVSILGVGIPGDQCRLWCWHPRQSGLSPERCGVGCPGPLRVGAGAAGVYVLVPRAPIRADPPRPGAPI